MTARTDSDEKYILDLVAQVLAEPDYLWQHRFPKLVGDPGQDGKQRPLPVDGYFPRHRLIVEFWEKQHSAPVGIMDEGISVSGVSRGHQRRLYDARRQAFADAEGLRLVILDYRGFVSDPYGRLQRRPAKDREIVAAALRAARAIDEAEREPFDAERYVAEEGHGCCICRIVQGDASLPEQRILWRDNDSIAWLNRLPAVFGHLLVAPTRHCEQVSGDFSLHQYLALQRVVHAVAEAVRLALRPERVYVLSLGTQQAPAHVHWHIVPCPPGRPGEEQLAVLDIQHRGVLKLTSEQREQLAIRLKSYLPPWMQERARSG